MISDYERVADAIRFVDARFREQPSLGQVAKVAGLSEFHFQRLFRRFAGISPKRFLQFLTAEYARTVLTQSPDVLDAAYDAGLSGPARLHDLFVNVYAATPAQVRDAGADLLVQYGFAATPFGECLMAQTDRGLCGLAFVEQGQRDEAFAELRTRWTSATFVREDSFARQIAASIFSAAVRAKDRPLTVFLQGTNFQVRVWEALLRIPFGKVATYENVAAAIGMPSAARAVGTAIGHNPIAYVIPCHRVLRKSGALGGYRWGVERKRTLFGWEAARVGAAVDDEG